MERWKAAESEHVWSCTRFNCSKYIIEEDATLSFFALPNSLKISVNTVNGFS
jgi:hypothetical protein